MYPKLKPRREFILNNKFVKITIDGNSTYFCRRCHSLKELDEPQCSCQTIKILMWIFMFVVVILPVIAVAIKLIKGG